MSTIFLVILKKSSDSKLIFANGSRVCASNPADIKIISGLNLSIGFKTLLSNIFNATLKAGTTSKEFITIFDQKVLKAIDKFKPEVILNSAGFDAHKRDPLANISLESDDFFKITKNIVDIANTHSNGRIISFLEGGYDLQALSESIIEHLNALKPHI